MEDELVCIQEFKDKVAAHHNIEIMPHSSLPVAETLGLSITELLGIADIADGRIKPHIEQTNHHKNTNKRKNE